MTERIKEERIKDKIATINGLRQKLPKLIKNAEELHKKIVKVESEMFRTELEAIHLSKDQIRQEMKSCMAKSKASEQVICFHKCLKRHLK